MGRAEALQRRARTCPPTPNRALGRPHVAADYLGLGDPFHLGLWSPWLSSPELVRGRPAGPLLDRFHASTPSTSANASIPWAYGVPGRTSASSLIPAAFWTRSPPSNGSKDGAPSAAAAFLINAPTIVIVETCSRAARASDGEQVGRRFCTRYSAG